MFPDLGWGVAHHLRLGASRRALRVIRGAENRLRCAQPLSTPMGYMPRTKEPLVDPNQAIQKHAQWKVAFLEAVSANKPMNAAVLSRDNRCELGKWLYGEAQAIYGLRPAHSQCLARHAAMHVEAGRVAAMLNARYKDEAERMIANGSAFSEASQAFILSLIELENEFAVDRRDWNHEDRQGEQPWI